MKVTLTHNIIKLIKLNVKDLSAGISSSHLSEAIAAGFGYRTNISLRTTLDHGPVVVDVSDADFRKRLTVLGGYRCAESLLSMAVHKATMGRIQAAANRYPSMTINGLNPRIGRGNIHKTQTDWKRDRAWLFGSDVIEMFLGAELWLFECKKAPKIYKGQSSYGMKHSAEEWLRKNHFERHCYIANGAFIAAAIANGFEVEEVEGQELNCWINVATQPSAYSGITTVCGRKNTYEVVALSMLTQFSGVIKQWTQSRLIKGRSGVSRFLVEHKLGRIQWDAMGRIRISGLGWSALLTVDGELANLAPQHVRSAILRGDSTGFMQWYRYMSARPASVAN